MRMPTAKKLPSGSWRIRIQVDGKIKSITRPTRREAEREAMRIKTGDAQISAFVSVADAMDHYIDSKRSKRSPSTIRGYACIRRFRFQGILHRDVNTITQSELQAAVDAEIPEVSPKTLKNAWGFLSACIAAETGRTFRVDLPEIVPHDRAWLTPEQIPVFVNAVRGKPIEIAALLALSSLRCSEIMDLEWKDVDLEKGFLRVTGAAVPGEDGRIVHKEQTKSRASRRTVPIIAPLDRALREVRNRGRYVVPKTENTIYKQINVVCKNAGLPPVGCHGLRHSFASLAWKLQIPEKVAMQIGGWSDDRTMKRIYTHIAESEMGVESGKFTQYFSDL